ncbi:MAG: glycosyltransferase family 2 protein [Acidobacteria bacterium]|nr:glycosyltransferase family 2 protein [Acidobacteriota bacterium]
MISIVIVNWNSGSLLEKCVRSLLTHAVGCQIIIVDNASSDSSLNFVDEIGTELSVMRNDRNAGFAAGSNRGWRESKGNVVLFLNPDVECLPGSISCLERTLACDPSIWAVGGRFVSPPGRSQKDFNVRAFPTVRSVFSEMFFLDEVWPSNPWSHIVHLRNCRQPLDVDQPAAACLMVTRTALEAIGGFDEAFYPAWFEDVDLCRRIRNKGGRIQFHPNACFVHHGSYSLGNISRSDFLESFHTNQIRYFRKHYGRTAARRVRRLILLGLFLRAGLSMIHPPAMVMSRVAGSRAFWNAARRICMLHEGEK